MALIVSSPKSQATPDSGTTAHCVQDTPTRTKYALVVEDTDLDGAQLPSTLNHLWFGIHPIAMRLPQVGHG